MARCGCATDCACTLVGGDCIDVSGSGTIDLPYTVSTRIDPDPSNGLSCGDSGLFVGSEVPVWTTETRPVGSTGYTYYDSTLNALLVKSGEVVGYTPPWNLPWGYISSASVTTSTTGSGTTPTAVTGLFVTWNAIANRRYRILVTGHVYSSTSVADSSVRVVIYDNTTVGSGNIITASDFVTSNTSATNVVGFSFGYSQTAAGTGSLTRQVAIRRGASGAANNPIFFAESVSPFREGRIEVHDIGPDGNPS